MWRKLVDYVADQNQHVPNNSATTRCTYRFVQNNGISRPALNRRGRTRISAFTGGMQVYQSPLVYRSRWHRCLGWIRKKKTSIKFWNVSPNLEITSKQTPNISKRLRLLQESREQWTSSGLMWRLCRVFLNSEPQKLTLRSSAVICTSVKLKDNCWVLN